MALTFGVTKTVFGVTNRYHEGEMHQPLFDEPLAVLLERELMNRYGPIVSNDNLRLVLGYASKEAFRQAVSRKTVPIAVFEIENRKGKFALIRDVALWLAAQRERAFIAGTGQPTGSVTHND
jgi:hypothetical protein